MKKLSAILSIALAASLAAGLSIGLAACGSENNNDHNGNASEAKHRTELNYDTDFSTLTSEKVSEAEWKTAFGNMHANRSICQDFHTDDPNDQKTAFVFSDGITIKIQTRFVLYCTKASDGTLTLVEKDGNGEIEKHVAASGSSNYAEMLEEYEFYFKTAYPDFSNYYNAFTYDDTKKSYVQKSDQLITTNAIMETNSNTKYTLSEVKIIDGDLAYITCKLGEYNYYTLRFYDYDKNSSISEPTEG